MVNALHLAVAALVALGVGLVAQGDAANAAGAVSADRLSGLAIAGFDPVAYHMDGRAQAGRPEQELEHGGAVWRFASEANRAAFLRAPDLYAPRVGGFDAEAAARGIVAGADASLFLLVEERLYLFRSREARDRFRADAGMRARAEAGWPALEPEALR